MKRTIIYAILSLTFAASAMADDSEIASLKSQIAVRAALSKGGLIVAVTERGEVSTETAWLVAKQVQRNDKYTPMLLTLSPETRVETLKTLNLDASALPALIYFDAKGKEISRVTEISPATLPLEKKTTLSLN
ncbi:MAG: hypothetical protein ACKVN9_00095 [Methylophilaceae bacterium]